MQTLHQALRRLRDQSTGRQTGKESDQCNCKLRARMQSCGVLRKQMTQLVEVRVGEHPGGRLRLSLGEGLAMQRHKR